MRMRPSEYDAARTGTVTIDRDDRAIVRMFGRDPVKMIDGMVTNDIANAGTDRIVCAALLTPKGKMLADLRVLRREDDVLIESAAAALDNVTTTLRKFVPPLFARFETVDTLAVLGIYGPQAAVRLGEALGNKPLPDHMAEDDVAHRELAGGTAHIVRTLYTGDDGYDVIAAPAALAMLRERLEAAGAVPISHETLDVLRIEAGRPRWGADLDETVIPIEARLEERAISSTKGCYTGQEIIIRILHRGHVNWLLRGVLIDGAPPPGKGAQLLHPSEGRKLGRVTSACFSPRLDHSIALAYTRRELEPPVTLKLESVDGADVVVTDLPFPADRPRHATRA